MNRVNSILIVDDDDMVRDSVARCLRGDGYDVMEAMSGGEGFELTKNHSPDLVLLDVMLPDVSGMEICRRIKNEAALADVFVVLCSGEAMEVENKVDGLRSGADEYLVKPFGMREFLARVRTLLRLRNTTAALRASEDHYRRLIDILPDAICLISPDGRLMSVNSQTVSMLGYELAAELLNRSVFDFVPAPQSSKANARSTVHDRIVRNAEYTLLKKDGSAIQVELSATVTSGRNREIAGYVCVVRDITERKQAEKILHDSEERFRQLSDNVRDVFWMLDVGKNQIIFISPAYVEIWGRPVESLYASPQGWPEKIHPQDQNRVMEAIRIKLFSGSYDEVYRILRPDGTIRWIKDRAFPIRDASGKIYRVVGIAEDITDQKLAWDALRESEARKSAIMRVALDAIVTINHIGDIVELNAAAERFFFLGQEQMVGKSVLEVIPASLQAWFREGLAHRFSGKKGPAAGSRIEMSVLRADGTQFPAELTITRIEFKGEPNFTLYIRDITQRKRAEEELRSLPQRIIKAQEVERLRVARELHDGVNQIIASVKMRLCNVRDGLPPAQVAAREMLARSDKLLARALEENRHIAHNLHPVDLDKLGFLAACQNLCKEFERRTDLAVDCQIDSFGNKRLPLSIELNLFRIAQEALTNIEKHAGAKKIKLQAWLQDNSILLRISDDGRGFDVQSIGYSSWRNGHGLGLANMRERALALQGTYVLDSKPKKGTTITIQIPYSENL